MTKRTKQLLSLAIVAGASSFAQAQQTQWPTNTKDAEKSASDDAQALKAATHRLRIGLYSASALSVGRAQTYLDDMNSILQDAEPGDPNDAACPTAQFVLNGSPQPYSNALPVVLGSKEDMDAFAAGGFSVYVVRSIAWCSGPAGQGFTILGCAREGGPVVVTLGQHPSVVIAHEIGHGQGLKHYPIDQRNLMYPNAISSMRGVVAFQCKEFSRPQLFPIQVASSVAQPSAIAAVDKPNLENLLGSDWIHGPPLDAINALTDAELDQIRSAIRDRTYRFWVNAIQVIGLRGAPTDVDLFRAVLNESVAANPLVIQAKLAAALALGWFANRTQSIEAGALLAQLATPEGAIRAVEGSSEPEADASGVFAQAARGVALSKQEIPNAIIENQRARLGRGDFNLRISPSFFGHVENLRNRAKTESLESILTNPAR